MAALKILDSRALSGDHGALAAVLARDGYLFLPGLLPAHEVTRVREGILARARAAGWLSPHGSESGDGVPPADPGAAVWDPSPLYRAVHWDMWRQRAVHALMHHPALTDIMAGLLGTSALLVHPRKVLRVVHPRGDGAPPESGWHQDFPGVQGSPRTLTAWTPLVPAGPGTGVLEVVPCSHLDGVLPMRLSNEGVVGWESALRPREVHTGHMAAGDVLILTSHTVHRGGAHTGNGLRISLDCRYQPADEPVNADCVEPASATWGWDDVYRSWPASRDDPLVRYWQRRRLHLVPYDTRADELRDREAIAAGRAGDHSARRALEITAAYGANPAVAAEAVAVLRRLTGAAGG